MLMDPLASLAFIGPVTAFVVCVSFLLCVLTEA